MTSCLDAWGSFLGMANMALRQRTTVCGADAIQVSLSLTATEDQHISIGDPLRTAQSTASCEGNGSFAWIAVPEKQALQYTYNHLRCWRIV